MAGLRRVVRYRTVRWALLLGVGWGVWETYSAVSAPSKIGPDLLASLESQPRVRIVVRLAFAPEEFHIRRMQVFGIIGGTKGDSLLLTNVRPMDVRRIARYFWVREISLARNGAP